MLAVSLLSCRGTMSNPRKPHGSVVISRGHTMAAAIAALNVPANASTGIGGPFGLDIDIDEPLQAAPDPSRGALLLARDG